MSNEYLKRKSDETLRKADLARTNKITELVTESHGDLCINTHTSYTLDLSGLKMEGLADYIAHSFSGVDRSESKRLYNRMVSDKTTILTSQNDPKRHVAIYELPLGKTTYVGYSRFYGNSLHVEITEFEPFFKYYRLKVDLEDYVIVSDHDEFKQISDKAQKRVAYRLWLQHGNWDDDDTMYYEDTVSRCVYSQKLKKTNIPGFKRNVWVEKFVRFSDREDSWIQTILTNKNGRQIDITQGPKPSPMMIRVAR